MAEPSSHPAGKGHDEAAPGPEEAEQQKERQQHGQADQRQLARPHDDAHECEAQPTHERIGQDRPAQLRADDQGAQEEGGRGLRRPGERQDGEDQGRDDAHGGGGRQGARLQHQTQAPPGQRADAQCGERERCGRTQREAEGGGGHGGDHQLAEIEAAGEAAGGAQGLEDGDGRGLLLEMRRHRARDPEPADDQDGQRRSQDQGPAEGDAALDPRNALGGIDDPPAGMGQAGFDRPDHRHRVLARLEAQATVPVDRGPWCGETGGQERISRDQHTGAEGEGAQRPVWLGQDTGPDLDLQIAQAQAVADGEIQPVEEIGVDRSTEAAPGVAQGQHCRFASGDRRVEQEATIERVGFVERLELDEQAAAAVDPPCPGAQLGNLAEHAEIRQERALGRGRLAVKEAEREVAADGLLGGGPGVVAQAVGDRAHGGDGGDREDQGGGQEAKTARGAPQVPPGEPPGQAHAAITRSADQARSATTAPCRSRKASKAPGSRAMSPARMGNESVT